MAYGHSSFCDKNLATYHPKITQDSHKRSTANLWKTSEWAQCPHHPSLEKNGCLSMPQSLICVFFPKPNSANKLSTWQDTPIGIFPWFFSDKNKPQVMDDSSPQPIPITEFFGGNRDPGSSWRFHPWQVPTHRHDVGEAPGWRSSRNAEDRMSIWLGGLVKFLIVLRF